MNPSIQEIKKMIPSLPARDIKIAEKLLEERKFQSLLELINSDIYLVNKDQAKEEPKDEYKDINIDHLLMLKSSVIEYMSYLVLPDEDDLDTEYFDDYD